VPFYLLPDVHEKIKETQPPQRCLFQGKQGYFAVHVEFLGRMWRGMPTALPPIEHQEGDDGAEKAVEQRRNEIATIATGRATFDMAEVAKHTTKEDCWIVINGVVMDVTTFISEHPGGETVLASKGGRDVSNMFKMIHPVGTLERHLPDRCIVGCLAGTTPGGLLEQPLLSGS